MSAGWSVGSRATSGRGPVMVGRIFVAGPLVSCAALAALAVHMPTQSAEAWVLSALLFGVGLGVGLCWPHLMTGVFRSAPEGQQEIASAAITTLQMYAMALGASVAGMAANVGGFTEPGGLAGAQRAAVVVYVVFTLAPAAAIWLGLRTRPVLSQS